MSDRRARVERRSGLASRSNAENLQRIGKHTPRPAFHTLDYLRLLLASAA